jgi:hypothetical protein
VGGCELSGHCFFNPSAPRPPIGWGWRGCNEIAGFQNVLCFKENGDLVRDFNPLQKEQLLGILFTIATGRGLEGVQIRRGERREERGGSGVTIFYRVMGRVGLKTTRVGGERDGSR